MHTFATILSTMDKAHGTSGGIWLKIGLAIVVLILLVSIARKIAQMNKAVLGVIVVLTFSFVGFNWIYERNEPTWAKPVVEKLAGFFPTKAPHK